VLFFNSTNVTIQGNIASGARSGLVLTGSLRFEGNNHNVNISYNNNHQQSRPGRGSRFNGVPGDNTGSSLTSNNISGNGNQLHQATRRCVQSEGLLPARSTREQLLGQQLGPAATAQAPAMACTKCSKATFVELR